MTAIVAVFKQAKVGIEVIGWLVGDGINELRKACCLIAEAYKASSAYASLTTPPEKAILPVLTPLHLSIPLGAYKSRPMSKLFRNSNGVIYCHRDGDLDNWFAANSPETVAGTARLVKTPKAMTFKQMAQSATGNASDSIADLSRAIVAQNLDITPTQWDAQIVATQGGEDILLINSYVSSAFTKTGNKLKDEKGQEYDEVVVLYAYRVGDG